MMRFLFPRLTQRGSRGRALFKAVVDEARLPHWYRQGNVPDTLDGRFAALATLVALTTLRLERGGDAAQLAAVALAERFVEAMDAEHREMGIGDPALGKKVRKLIGSLSKRTGRLREALADTRSWTDAVRDSLYQGAAVQAEALEHCAHHLRLFWARLAAVPDDALAEGRIL